MKLLKHIILLGFIFFFVFPCEAQEKIPPSHLDTTFQDLKFRNIGPLRGGRSVASTGVIGNSDIYYMGGTGGGVWKTTDAGTSWKNISDGYLSTGSVGAIAVAASDPNVIYLGMGEHAVRGVMTSYGDGVYKSVDAGQSWTKMGLDLSRHIAKIVIHPQNPDIVYVAVQGAVHGPTKDRGIYKSTDGGKNWENILFVNETTGASDISMDAENPRILYAGTWDHIRYPWQVRSGGEGSALYKSVDAGVNWVKLEKGLPKELGKTSIDVSPANPNVVYANLEAEGEKAGVYKSMDAGNSWQQVCKDRVTVARAWYYIEIFADPKDENTVYVLNAPMLKSIDGGRTFRMIQNPHGDQHDMWINPDNPENIILANDGGACVTFNGGTTWSSQQNQPTAQFYRVITDNRHPYYVYGGQQDNSTVAIASRTRGGGIGWKDWYAVAGGESAFLAFDEDDPRYVFGGSIQGFLTVFDHKTRTNKDIMAYPITGLGWTPKDMKYRFNWNAPLISSPQNPKILYHAANVVLKSEDNGQNWVEVSPDLTRNEKEKQGLGGVPFTNEGAGGEVYNTISYLEASQHSADVLWAGSDCGMIHVTQDGGKNWSDVTPKGLGEMLVNCIDVSPHNPGTAYAAVTNYKMNDFQPYVYKTENYGKSWTMLVDGIESDSYLRVVREDPERPDLLYAGTERGMYISYNGGEKWQKLQLNLPIVPITDLTFRNNDLVVATQGRAFWILDDLSPIQQYEEDEDIEIAIYTPKENVRFMRDGGGRGLSMPNPTQGVIIDYFLSEDLVDSLTLTMNIKDSKGKVIRSYSNKKDPDYRPTPGAQPEPILLSKGGNNRFSWDMRREAIPSVPGVMILGGYEGSMVAPGTYTVELTNGIDTVETDFSLTADPDVEASQSDYDEQARSLVSLEHAIVDIQESVIRFKNIKEQIVQQKTKLVHIEGTDSLKTLADSALTRINTWEANLIQSKQQTFQDVINFPNQLNAEIVMLMGRISSGADPRLTGGAKMRMKELHDEWQEMKREMNNIISEDITEFNNAFAEAKIPALVLPKAKKKNRS